jgi:hypothetical protein
MTDLVLNHEPRRGLGYDNALQTPPDLYAALFADVS